ncbi:Ankyrin repeat [Pyrenophora seminiperda CCB06]|uniref:Ankyrin repeat n=1 Tax=Pyrenophora seminiperda CCB06 TaxID=1302712 RepID=A0A3M7MIY9_9PLEO|nr:Ankyrin repeat [Pyrenophora seminiperda CCB06]
MESASHEGKSALHYAAMSGEMDAFKYLISVGYDPYKLDDGNKCSPVCYALSHHHLSSYVYASCLDLTHLLPGSVLQQGPKLSYRNHASRFLFRTLTRDPTLSCIQDLFDNGSTPLTSCATHGDLEGIVQGIKAGFGLEMRDSHGRTALMNACRHGRLSLVSFLVRQGSILEYTHEGQRITALQAARGHSNIIEWLLVKRWTKQGRITGSAFNSDKRERPWAGIRTVEIPLRGKYERSQDTSLLEHAIDLHGMARNGWRDMVPLGWDTVAHLVALPTDL